MVRQLLRRLAPSRLVESALHKEAHFDEAGYLAANPDVAMAVARGDYASGSEHFKIFGHAEDRRFATTDPAVKSFRDAKSQKLARIRPWLRTDLPMVESDRSFDFLSDALRAEFNIVDTDAVSSGNYDGYALNLINRHRDGLVLDCGAGKRQAYFDNVVNFEIVDYESTDVRGVGEVLPFVDGTFDAVISIAVLEHVKDPFRCAREIVRVLKPGGELMCCVPFLQPYHGYPHHYYNMTHQGLRNLFEGPIAVDRIEVYASVLPIWSLTWMVSSWAQGLSGSARDSFLNLRLRDLLNPAPDFLGKDFVTELPAKKNLELASACVLFGRKG